VKDSVLERNPVPMPFSQILSGARSNLNSERDAPFVEAEMD